MPGVRLYTLWLSKAQLLMRSARTARIIIGPWISPARHIMTRTRRRSRHTGRITTAPKPMWESPVAISRPIRMVSKEIRYGRRVAGRVL